MKKLIIGAGIACVALSCLMKPNYKDIDVNVRIAKGDTVWTVVDEAMKEVGDQRYILEVISETKKLNNITPDKVGNMPIGTVIVVPCKVRI